MPHELRCPDDGKELPLQTFVYNGRIVPYHACPQCEGAFVTGDDLRNFATDAHIDLEWERGADKPREHWRHCPTCVRGLIQWSFEGVQFDVCTSCEGVWFDKGELRKLKRKGRRDFLPAPEARKGVTNPLSYLLLGWALGSLFD